MNFGFIEYLYKSINFLKQNNAKQKKIEIAMELVKKKADKIVKKLKTSFN